MAEYTYDQDSYTQLASNLVKKVADMNATSNISQTTYVNEECSELIKELAKEQRGKGDDEHIIEEACDVLVTVLGVLHLKGATQTNILSRMIYKCNRALEDMTKDCK